MTINMLHDNELDFNPICLSFPNSYKTTTTTTATAAGRVVRAEMFKFT